VIPILRHLSRERYEKQSLHALAPPAYGTHREMCMRKTLVSLAAVALVVALSAALAVGAGASAPVSDCPGAPPAGVTHYRVAAADGNCLQGYVWAPAGVPVRGVVVVVHGLGDHARRYAELARTLNADGFAVVAQDLRGHAGSGGARQRLDSIEQLLADAALAQQQARQRFPQAPVFLHGHSLGGLVVAQASARQGLGLAGAIISSAALTMPPGTSDGQRRVVSLIAALAPGLGLDTLDPARVLRDPGARAALVADPLIQRDKLPARTITTLLGGVVDLQPRMSGITTPLLILHGQADRITDPAGSQLLHDRAASTVKQLRGYDGALHDLLHEPEAEQVRREVLAFVSAQAAGR
jgi:acylglycerol lipase